MTLFSQENNISPSQKYEITDIGLVLNRYEIPLFQRLPHFITIETFV